MMAARTAIGIDIGGTGTKGGLVTDRGEIIARLEHPTKKDAGTKSVLALSDDLLARAEALGITVEAFGIGAAGFIDSATGTVTFAPNLVYDDPEVGKAVRAHVDLPVTIDNDANAAAWGELHFGAGKGMSNIVFMTLGTGIGSGIVVDGRLVRGATGAGAELGHTVIAMDGPPCNCGLNGCLEAMASGSAIARMAGEGLRSHPDSKIASFASSIAEVTALDVAEAARANDELAARILSRAGRALGVGLSNVVNLFDPETIVLGGSVIGAGEAYLGPARDELAAMTGEQRRRPVRLDVTTLGHDGGILGAAALALVDQQEEEA